jgi:hypothetical protein
MASYRLDRGWQAKLTVTSLLGVAKRPGSWSTRLRLIKLGGRSNP